MRKFRYRLAFSLLALGTASPLTAQPDPTGLLRTADRFFEAGSYEASITECWRFLYFADEHPLRFYAYYRGALAQEALGRVGEALRMYQWAFYNAPDRTIQEHVKYRTALTLLAVDNLELAKIELLQLSFMSKDEALTSNAGIMLGLLFTFQEQWLQAREAFGRAAQQLPDHTAYQESMKAVDAQIAVLVERPRRKSPRLAKWISTFVPGSGQLYAGNVWHGFNALAINTGTTYLVARAIQRRSVRDAFLLSTNLWWRYYQGNRLHAEEDAIRVNEAYQEEVLNDLYLLIQDAGRHLPDEPQHLTWNDIQPYLQGTPGSE